VLTFVGCFSVLKVLVNYKAQLFFLPYVRSVVYIDIITDEDEIETWNTVSKGKGV